MRLGHFLKTIYEMGYSLDLLESLTPFNSKVGGRLLLTPCCVFFSSVEYFLLLCTDLSISRVSYSRVLILNI